MQFRRTFAASGPPSVWSVVWSACRFTRDALATGQNGLNPVRATKHVSAADQTSDSYVCSHPRRISGAMYANVPRRCCFFIREKITEHQLSGNLWTRIGGAVAAARYPAPSLDRSERIRVCRDLCQSEISDGHAAAQVVSLQDVHVFRLHRIKN